MKVGCWAYALGLGEIGIAIEAGLNDGPAERGTMGDNEEEAGCPTLAKGKEG